MHDKDQQAKWFGVVRDKSGRPVFEDYGRYEVLAADNAERSCPERLQFPQLVSFIGVTNSGKSTVIKLLISLATGEFGPADFPSPVTGSVVDESVPTSGEVSMYADPASGGDSHPVVYIDCEGFEGGEKTPLGSRARRHDFTSDACEEQAQPSVRSRRIKWATTEESRQREYAVTKLYPRILYTFSDCVVFVLRNPKTFQSSVLTKLIDWGAAALERSINQPALPHCIVVLNCSDAALETEQWDADAATQTLLFTVRGAIDHAEGVPQFRALAEHWRDLGRNICSIEDLILCYYSSFKVVRLPTGSQLNRMKEQVSLLRRLIGQCCQKSSQEKHHTRMLSDTVELGKYLQSGFDHFTSHLDIPFDFMQVSLAHNPVPHNFGDHILQLCLAIQRLCFRDQDSTRRLLERVGSFVASCVLLDCIRRRKGRLDMFSSRYESHFERAVDEYMALHAVCAYTSPDGSRRCVMAQARHSAKGHQDYRGIIASGGKGFVSPFGPGFASQWTKQLKEALSQLQIDFGYRRERTNVKVSDRYIAWDLHLECAEDFYANMGSPVTMIKSHSTCLCCLIESPECILPCGHVLCEECTRACGRDNGVKITVDRCPLHHTDARWERPAEFRFKSSEAGACVLSLDGGGVRGIVQLETLRAIEQALGSHVPVHRLFDILVGAGTGGLVAVSLAAGGRSIEQCLDLFLATCDHAYEADGGSTSLVGKMTRLMTDARKAKTSGLHGALKDAFTGHRGFFGEVNQYSPEAKIALLCSVEGNQKTSLLANYRRPASNEGLDHDILMTDDPDAGPRTWQAVAAAMADASNFRAVSVGQRKFVDGDTCGSNPIEAAAEEVSRLWPATRPTMVCLSLGTGQDRCRVAARLQAETVRGGVTSTVHRRPDTTPAKLGSLFLARRRNIVKDGILDAERTWQKFKSVTAQVQPHAKGHGLIRLNPDVGVGREPPYDHDHSSLRRLQASVRDTLDKPYEREVMRRTANRLIATTFYLHTAETFRLDSHTQEVNGDIACRFEEDLDMVKGLGRVLKDQFVEGFEPYFELRPVADSAQISSRISLTAGRIEAMVSQGLFQRPEVRLCLDRSSGEPSSIQLFFAPSAGHIAHGYPLGGLPRVLVDSRPSSLSLKAARQPMGLTQGVYKAGNAAGSVSGSLSLMHPSVRSSRQSSEDRRRPSSFDALNLDRWSSSKSAATYGSTDTPDANRASSRRQDSPISEDDASGGDTVLLPRGLVVRRSSQRLSRRRSVLLPPPVTLERQPGKRDLHFDLRPRVLARTIESSVGVPIPVSPHKTSAEPNPIEYAEEGEELTWTSSSHYAARRSLSSGTTEVCTAHAGQGILEHFSGTGLV